MVALLRLRHSLAKQCCYECTWEYHTHLAKTSFNEIPDTTAQVIVATRKTKRSGIFELPRTSMLTYAWVGLMNTAVHGSDQLLSLNN